MGSTKHFFEKAKEDPCVGCSAPCCQAFFMPYPAPGNYMDLDAMLYLLGFPNAEMILTSDGNWKVMIEGNCRFFDPDNNLCSIYGTSRRPKTCQYFNPHQCWHKRNFHPNSMPPEIVRIDLSTLEAILAHVHFDEAGNIIEIPAWEVLQELAEEHRLDVYGDLEVLNIGTVGKDEGLDPGSA